jgi:hypothetical protein
MKSVHTILREDFGRLDKRSVRRELLKEPGIRSVSFEGHSGVNVEYDPKMLDEEHLTYVLCRCGLYPTARAAVGNPEAEPSNGSA